MRRYIRIDLCFAFVVILFYMPSSVHGQDAQKPIQVSPLIGDTLDAVEREYYHLLPTVDGFRWAVFYLNADSTLTAKVTAVANGMRYDTLIQQYRSLNSLRGHLESLGKLKREERGEGGADVTILLSSGSKIHGELLSVRESALVISVPGIAQRLSHDTGERIEVIGNQEIKKVTINGGSKVLKGMGWGFVIGGGAGALIGLASGDDPPCNQDQFICAFHLSAGQKALLGGVLGGGLGLLVGTIVGIASSSADTEIDRKSVV